MNKRIWLLLLTLLSASQVLAEPAPRIVSAGGSVTEIIYSLGRGDWVVATDNTSMYPTAAATLPKLGYFRQLSTEGVLAQRPTRLIGAQATGPDAMLSQVADAGVKVTVLNEQRSIAGLMTMIDELGASLNAVEKANLLKAQVQDAISHEQSRAAKLHTSRLTALFVLADSDRGLTVAGTDTVPQALFDTLGMRNAAEHVQQYKIMDNESIVAAAPDIILVASHAMHGQQISSMCRHPALAATPAGKACRLEAMESSVALGLSPRLPEALATLNNIAADVGQTSIQENR